MKRHPLDIAILVCFIIVIILVVILVWPTGDSNKNSSSKKNISTKEEVTTKEKVTTSDDSNTSDNQTLFTDTTPATNEEEVVSYIEDVETEVNNLTSQSSSDRTVKERLEDTFITLTDFIFYGGTIKGVTFSELTDTAKEKVLTLYENIDSKIEEHFPNYKENIKSTAERGYNTAVSKAKELKDSIVSKYKETVGDEAYNNVVGSFEEDKDRFQDAYSPYVEKGKEIGSKAVEKGKEVWKKKKKKLDSWYQDFKESR